jgi:hypothetical protein
MVGSWIASRFASGFNGVVWRANSSNGGEVAVKLSLVDAKRRGQRKFAATRRLVGAGLDLTPVPLVLVQDADLTALVSLWRSGRWFPRTIRTSSRPGSRADETQTRDGHAEEYALSMSAKRSAHLSPERSAKTSAVQVGVAFLSAEDFFERSLVQHDGGPSTRTSTQVSTRTSTAQLCARKRNLWSDCAAPGWGEPPGARSDEA